MKGFIWLITAIIFEVCGTTSMKLADGFSRIVPSVLIFFFYGISFVCLTFALKWLDISIAYAIWAGLGTVLVAIIGMVYFREPTSAFKFISIGFIIIGVVGLNLSMKH